MELVAQLDHKFRGSRNFIHQIKSRDRLTLPDNTKGVQLTKNEFLISIGDEVFGEGGNLREDAVLFGSLLKTGGPG